MKNNPLKISFDSNEVLYSLVLENKDALNKQSFKRLKDQVIDKSLNDLLKMSFSDFSKELCDLQAINFFRLALYDFRGDVFTSETLELKDNPLICRCNLLLESDLKKIYKDVKGVRKEFYKNSNASMICSNCTQEVSALIESMRDELYEGKRLESFSSVVETELEDFSLHSPLEFQDISFQLISIVPGKVRIRAKRGKTKVKRERIRQVMCDYLDPKILQLFEISIIVSD